MIRDLLQYIYSGCKVAVVDNCTGEVLVKGLCGTVYVQCFTNDWLWEVTGVKDMGSDELLIYVKTGEWEEA